MSLAASISAYNRNRKWRLFNRALAPGANTKVLDVGFSEKEYTPTDNYIEQHYPWPENLTALGIEQPDTFRTRYPSVQTVVYDGSVFPFEDKTFDICWSNAVIEHVGSRENQLTFLREVHRVAHKAFLTTPNRWFPIEIHTRTPLLHYLPKPMFERYLHACGKDWATGSYMNLLSIADAKQLLKEAGISDYRIYSNRLAGFTMDFVIVIGSSSKG